MLIVLGSVSKKVNHLNTNDNFYSSCPISAIFLVQILRNKYAIERWFNLQPLLLSVRTLPWETLRP